MAFVKPHTRSSVKLQLVNSMDKNNQARNAAGDQRPFQSHLNRPFPRAAEYLTTPWPMLA